MRLAISASLIGAFGAALIFGGAAADDSVTRGETLARTHCARCHAVNAVGPSRDPAAPPLRELHRRYPGPELARALGAGILVGHPMMPAFPFSTDDVRALVRYLETIQTRQAG